MLFNLFRFIALYEIKFVLYENTTTICYTIIYILIWNISFHIILSSERNPQRMANISHGFPWEKI